MSVRRTCDCRLGGRSVKCVRRDGSVRRVVSWISGWSGAASVFVVDIIDDVLESNTEAECVDGGGLE